MSPQAEKSAPGVRAAADALLAAIRKVAENKTATTKILNVLDENKLIT